MVVVVMRRVSCDDFDTELVRSLRVLYFRRGVRVHAVLLQACVMQQRGRHGPNEKGAPVQ